MWPPSLRLQHNQPSLHLSVICNLFWSTWVLLGKQFFQVWDCEEKVMARLKVVQSLSESRSIGAFGAGTLDGSGVQNRSPTCWCWMKRTNQGTLLSPCVHRPLTNTANSPTIPPFQDLPRHQFRKDWFFGIPLQLLENWTGRLRFAGRRLWWRWRHTLRPG